MVCFIGIANKQKEEKMIIKTELVMSDFEQPLEMKALNWEIVQTAREGLEYGRPLLKNIHFSFYDSKLIPYFFEWAKSGNSKRTGKIHYISSDMGKVECSFNFKDAVCSECQIHFNSMKEAPLCCEVSLSVCLQKQDLVKGKGEKAKVAESAPVEQENKMPKLIDYFITDTNGDKLDEYNTGDRILLQIKTQNRIGNQLTINLNDKTHDFKYNGVSLENDTLEYVIGNDLEKIELEVIEQQN